jgi:hypothetical protein
MAQRNWFMPDTALQRQQNGTAIFVEVLVKGVQVGAVFLSQPVMRETFEGCGRARSGNLVTG